MFVADTWNAGIAQLPYLKEVVDSFKKFRDEAMKIEVAKRMGESDAQPFTNYIGGYVRTKYSNGGTVMDFQIGAQPIKILPPMQVSRQCRGWSMGGTMPARYSARPAAGLHHPQTCGEVLDRNTKSVC